MTNSTCEELVALARSSLSEQFEVDDLGEWCRVSTPHRRHDNDAIEIYLRTLASGEIEITDGGETFDYLRMSGFVTRRNRSFRRFLMGIEDAFKIKLEGEQITARVTEDRFPDAFEAVTRAALHTSYMVFKRRERLAASFDDRVEVELIRAGARYEPDVDILGASASYRFRFLVDSGLNAVIQPLSARSTGAANDKAERFLFHVVDVQRRTDAYRFYPILDDAGSAGGLWQADILSKLSTYSSGIIRWSDEHREEQLRQVLSAS